MADLHDRMPVVVPETPGRAGWIPSSTDPANSTACSSRPTRSRSGSGPVSRLVNNVRNDGPELVEPRSPTLRLARGLATRLFDELGGPA